MVKRILHCIIFFFFLIPTELIVSQNLTFGLQFNHSEFSFDINKETYYFSDAGNITFTATDIDSKREYYFGDLIPGIYFSYDSKNNFYSETGISIFFSDNDIECEYNDRWGNSGNSSGVDMKHISGYFISGYKFRNANSLKPYIFGGISSMMYLKDKHALTVNGDTYYGTSSPIAFILRGIRPLMLNYRFGSGLEYRGFSFDICYESNILPLEKIENPFFKKFTAIHYSVNIDIMRFDLRSNKNVKKLNVLKEKSNLF